MRAELLRRGGGGERSRKFKDLDHTLGCNRVAPLRSGSRSYTIAWLSAISVSPFPGDLMCVGLFFGIKPW